MDWVLTIFFVVVAVCIVSVSLVYIVTTQSKARRTTALIADVSADAAADEKGNSKGSIESGTVALVLVRHGESCAQELLRSLSGRKGRFCRSTFGELRDAKLSSRGRQQASRLQHSAPLQECTLVLVSPLTRALETACIAFENSPARIVALPSLAEFSLRRQHTGAENIGRPLQELFLDPALSELARFQSVDFSKVEEVEQGGGVWWSGHESRQAGLSRLNTLRQYLQRLPPLETVAIVGHSGSLASLLRTRFFRVRNCVPIVCDLRKVSGKVLRRRRFFINRRQAPAILPPELPNPLRFSNEDGETVAMEGWLYRFESSDAREELGGWSTEAAFYRLEKNGRSGPNLRFFANEMNEPDALTPLGCVNLRSLQSVAKLDGSSERGGFTFVLEICVPITMKQEFDRELGGELIELAKAKAVRCARNGVQAVVLLGAATEEERDVWVEALSALAVLGSSPNFVRTPTSPNAFDLVDNVYSVARV